MGTTFRKSASPAGIATEVTSLQWLAEAVPDGGAAVVELLASGDTWLETRMLSASSPSQKEARAFGRSLATTHAAGAEFLGAAPPGLGVEHAVLAELPSPALTAAVYSSWGPFFAELRLRPYVRLARDKGALSTDQCRRLSTCIDRVASGDFDADQPRAVQTAPAFHQHTGPAVARLHGDLWGGNVVWASSNHGVTGTLIDPNSSKGTVSALEVKTCLVVPLMKSAKGWTSDVGQYCAQ